MQTLARQELTARSRKIGKEASREKKIYGKEIKNKTKHQSQRVLRFTYFQYILLFFFKGHSRRGNCLLKLKRKKEALVAFCKGHTYASSDREKNFTAKEVISTATELPGQSFILLEQKQVTFQNMFKFTKGQGQN